MRAALAWNEETARLAREHNDANVVAIGARDAHRRGGDRASWCCSCHPVQPGPRHVRRIGLLTDYERDRHRPAGGLPTRSQHP